MLVKSCKNNSILSHGPSHVETTSKQESACAVTSDLTPAWVENRYLLHVLTQRLEANRAKPTVSIP